MPAPEHASGLAPLAIGHCRPLRRSSLVIVTVLRSGYKNPAPHREARPAAQRGEASAARHGRGMERPGQPLNSGLQPPPEVQRHRIQQLDERGLIGEPLGGFGERLRQPFLADPRDAVGIRQRR